MKIDTSREAVERVRAYIERRRKDRGADQEVVHGYDVGHSARPDGYMLNVSDIAALLAERDAALAEVARLSQAPAAETAKREAMEEALRSYEDQLCEGFCEDFPDRSFIDEKCEFDCGGCIARATLAKHGSKT